MTPAEDFCSIWQWLSIAPGRTSLPLASMSRAPAARADVALRRVGGGRDRAVADHQIVVGHPMFLMIARAIARSSATRNALRRGIAITRLLPPGSGRKARSLPRPRNTPTPAP